MAKSSSPGQEKIQLIALLELLKSGYWYEKRIQAVLKPFGISHEQYNVLRILEHHRPRKFSLKEIQRRLMNQTENTTRLVEKLRSKELLTSEHSKTDRRNLEITITAKGSALLRKIKPRLFELIANIETVMPDPDAKKLIQVLRQFRNMDSGS